MTLSSNSKKSDTKSTHCFMVDCLRGRLSKKRKKLKFSSPIEPNLEVVVCNLVKQDTSGNKKPSEKFTNSSTSN